MNLFKTLVASFIVAISMVNCSTTFHSLHFRTDPVHKGIDYELEPYVQEFIHRSGGTVTEKDLYNLSIGFRKFDEKDSNIAGLCFYTPFFREIDINIEWWEAVPDQRLREELMFHELGHCVLYRAHTSPTSTYGVVGWFESVLFELGLLEDKGRLSDGCPVSYMHPNVIGPFCIDKHYNYYMKELFQKRHNKAKIGFSTNIFIRYQDHDCKH